MKKYIILLMTSTLLFSCKKDDTVMVQFFLKSSGKTPFGRSYLLDQAKTKMLFSNFRYVDNMGKETLVKDVFLYKKGENGFGFKVPSGNFTSFRFSFGLDKATNNSTPSSFPASNPLSVETGLYWDMLKYRFLIVEGDIDDSPTKDNTPDAPFSMHLGGGTLYTEINVTDIPAKGNTMNIELDMDKLFMLDSDPFLITNFSNHSEAGEVSRGIAIKNSFVSGIKATVLRPE